MSGVSDCRICDDCLRPIADMNSPAEGGVVFLSLVDILNCFDLLEPIETETGKAEANQN